MTSYNVHLYREMRLFFAGIEAESAEAAATLAHEKSTREADDCDDCNGEDISALVDVAGDEDYSQSVVIDFEAERQRKAAAKLLAALRAVLLYAENEAAYLEKMKDGAEIDAEAEKAWKAVEAAQAALALAAAVSPAERIDTADNRKPYSVLLAYPDYLDDTGSETYYAFVTAADAIEAVAVAQRQAVAAEEDTGIELTDFAPLLVTQGHQRGEPLFNR